MKQGPRRIRERLQNIFTAKALNEAAIAKLDRRLIALGVAGHPEREFAARFSAIRAYDVAGRRALLEEAQDLGRAIDAATAVPLSALLAQVAANTAMLHTVAVHVGVDPAVRTNPLAVVTSREELSELVHAATEGARSAKAQGGWMTAEEVAELLGYKPRYIAELTRRGNLPCHQPNGARTRKMFRRSEVEAWAACKGDDHGQD